MRNCNDISVHSDFCMILDNQSHTDDNSKLTSLNRMISLSKAKMQEIWINKAVYQHPEINNTLAKCDFRRNVPESTYLVFELSIPNLSTFKALSWALIVGLSSAFRTVPCYRWSPPLFAQYYICQYRGLPGLMEITISCSRREDSPSYLLFLVSIVGVGVAVVVVAAGVVVVVGVAVVLRGKIYGYKAFISSIVK
ncbi:hypothetical protein Tco_1201324 [Tanacetum coccineum]